MDRRVFSSCACAALFIAGVTGAFAQDSRSAPLVKEFAQLAGGEMRYFAAKVPDSPNEFIGALHIPGVQLLVIWAQYEQPVILTTMLGKRDYQGVYSDLNSASYAVAASKVFVEDLRGDGLFAKRRDETTSFDAYQAAGKRFMFDGDWKKQKLSEKEYQEAFTIAEERYAKALGLLMTEMKR